MITFKAGDKIKCLNNLGVERFIAVGKTYIISSKNLWVENLVYITSNRNIVEGFKSDRFELTTQDWDE